MFSSLFHSTVAPFAGLDPHRPAHHLTSASYRISSPFICSYLDCFFHLYYKYFSIARIPRMGSFLNHIDNIISHLIMNNNFYLYSRNKFHHLIYDLVFCILGPAFAESFDFRYRYTRQPFIL